MIEIEIEPSDSGLVVALGGELDADNAPMLLKRVTTAKRDVVDVEFRIEALDFIDSSGISALLQLREIAIEDGGALRIVGPSRSVRRVFEIAGLLEVFGLS